MDRPLSHLNRFFELAAEKRLAGSDQLLYLHLFNAFNRARFPPTVTLTDEELLSRLGLYDRSGKRVSRSTLKNAKARLKMKGLIDFARSGGGTEYWLEDLLEEDANGSVRRGTEQYAGLDD